MSKTETALKLALKALEWNLPVVEDWGGKDNLSLQHKAITAIREALAQPEQEPVIWMYQDKSTHEVQFQKHMRSFVDHSKTSEVPLYSEPLANHELQCVCGAVWCGDEMVHLPNKIPPQRKPLTDEQRDVIARQAAENDWHDYEVIDAVESAHGIKE